MLVTGGSGFIGRATVRALLEGGASVTVADLRAFPDPDVPTVVGDLRDPACRSEAVATGTDTIVHLAAMTSVLRSVEEPVAVYDTNVAATAGLLELARERGIERFVFASTNAVAGDVGDQLIHEGLALAPLTPYGATKAAAEMLMSAYGASYGLQACALRLTNVYGRGMGVKDSFIARLLRHAKAGTEAQVYGDGEQRRDFVFLDDVVRAFTQTCGDGCSGVLVVGSGHSVTMNELLDEVRAVTGAALPARHTDPKPGEMRAVRVDVSRARQAGWEPQVDLRQGLTETWRDARGWADPSAP
ncbi:MAG: NAD-dependent epimerase/dehydratase family protein [Actinobacteria bacterium]|nr:NAD-dependent epimerase/dehydratase family protein [Actinomycetota bacterium]